MADISSLGESGVYRVQSDTDPKRSYRVDVSNPLHPTCQCLGAMHTGSCKHILAALKQSLGETLMPEETTKAVAVRPTAAKSMALQVQDALKSLEGVSSAYDMARHIAIDVIGPEAWPDDLRNDKQNGDRRAAQIVLTAANLGVNPQQAFSFITSIKGKPFLMARMVNALVSSRVPGGFIAIEKNTATECVGVGHRPGRPDFRYAFTIQDAQAAGYMNNDNYKKHPAAMLRARVTTAIGWQHFPDVCAGMDVLDEENNEPMYAAQVETQPGRIETAEAETTLLPNRIVTTEAMKPLNVNTIEVAADGSVGDPEDAPLDGDYADIPEEEPAPDPLPVWDIALDAALQTLVAKGWAADNGQIRWGDVRTKLGLVGGTPKALKEALVEKLFSGDTAANSESADSVIQWAQGLVAEWLEEVPAEA